MLVGLVVVWYGKRWREEGGERMKGLVVNFQRLGTAAEGFVCVVEGGTTEMGNGWVEGRGCRLGAMLHRRQMTTSILLRRQSVGGGVGVTKVRGAEGEKEGSTF